LQKTESALRSSNLRSEASFAITSLNGQLAQSHPFMGGTNGERTAQVSDEELTLEYSLSSVSDDELTSDDSK
jgi:hypothetical protein